MKNKIQDLIIIGAGPIGLACGIEAQKNDLEHLIFDKGCLVNSLYRYPMNMTFFSTSDKLEIGGVPFISHNAKPTRAEALEYYRRVTSHWKLPLRLYEKITEVRREDDLFEVTTDKGNYHSKKIIIATGFYDFPYLLNVPGEQLPKVLHYYKEAHPFFGMNVVVVGAANSAVDVALELYRKGSKSVTMIIREKEIGQNVKYWSKPDIINRIKEGSIKAYFDSQIEEITADQVRFKTPKEIKTIDNDFVLAMTGYQPNFELLESLGVQFHMDEYRTPIYDSDSMRSTTKGVYLAGVVCGGLKTNKWFIENSRDHASMIIEDIVGS
ncbi:MAG: YpdA family putative bacillithiol disulfide reductase [Flavobacteriaceae bacterium TMED42]|nr:MAG: YpdA family putative bacillithiol disulfide reductase [Flavobacteriaceae bacterium TMED42]|tara:strand:- start:5574 stop:6545 length:972 start_codon:yes stop_codon:yes gene_type:complete